ncbi:MAG: hypothetical protein JWM86_219 [Thermoleophilia bacterium]|nr:hypothetical protein [Thermoleophilia bacterium]
MVALVLAFMLLTGGDDIVPVTGVEGSTAVPGNPTDATGAAQAPGSTVGQPGQPGAAGTAAVAGGNAAPGAATGNDVESARATEQDLNRGVAPVNATGGGGLPPANVPASNPVTSPAPIVTAGRTLNSAHDKVVACMAARQGDVFDCLALVKDVVHVERIHETQPQGATLSEKASDGTVVTISFRGDNICRSLGTQGTDCNAWTVDGTPS